MIRRALLAAVAVAAVVSPVAPATALICDDGVTACPCYLRDTYLSGCTGPVVDCFRTPEAVICV